MRSQFWAMVAARTSVGIVGSIVLTTSVVSKAPAQLPLPDLRLPISSQPSDNSDNQVVTRTIRLDGRRLFQIAETRANLPKRVELYQQRLRTISQDYFQSDSSELQVEVKPQQPSQTQNQSPVISVNNQPLLTVTDLDAKMQGEDDAFQLAKRLSESLEEDLKRSKQERQTEFLVRRGGIAAGIFLGVVLSSWAVSRWHRRSRLQPIPATPMSDPVTTKLTQQQRRNMQEVRQRVFQLAQGIVWGSGTVIILGLFPYTRIIQVWILTALKIPFGLGIVGVVTYLAIRLSYVLIDQFTAALVNNALLTPEDSLRLQLRVSTISGVTKGIATFSGVAIGTLFALTTLGVNIAPLLAGAGLIGVALSLASQNLIKDAINGFFIILEDQYALGDVISVGTWTGFVENLNLRITQLRDAEGRLITIPNSEIKMVANLSSRWSRADLNIPVAYHADIDQVLKLIESVGLEMDCDPQWQDRILETPKVLGVENFGDRGLMIRVWIKTEPLKQWDVAREYRRRLKIAFDKAGIAIPFPQQAIWLNDGQLLKSHSDDGLRR